MFDLLKQFQLCDKLHVTASPFFWEVVLVRNGQKAERILPIHRELGIQKIGAKIRQRAWLPDPHQESHRTRCGTTAHSACSCPYEAQCCKTKINNLTNLTNLTTVISQSTKSLQSCSVTSRFVVECSGPVQPDFFDFTTLGWCSHSNPKTYLCPLVEIKSLSSFNLRIKHFPKKSRSSSSETSLAHE